MKQTWTKNLIQKDVTTITARNYKDGVLQLCLVMRIRFDLKAF